MDVAPGMKGTLPVGLVFGALSFGNAVKTRDLL